MCGIVSYQKYHFGYNLEGLGVKTVNIFYGDFGVFYGILVYFMAIWYILLPFSIVLPFWYAVHTINN
jgi:hypothetical protein